MNAVKVSPKHQVVITRDIRDALGIKAGQKVCWREENGTAVLIPVALDPVEELTGMFRDHPVSLSRELIRERRKDRDRDERRRL